MARLFDGEVHVAYMQFYVETPDMMPSEDVDRRFARQTNGLCGAGDAGCLHCITGLHTGSVPVAVERLDAAPADPDGGWEEVVEVSLTTTTPSVLLYDWNHQHPVELPLGEGSFRVRYHAVDMQAGSDADVRGPDEPVLDRYLLQFWPAPPAPDTVLRQTSRIAGYWHDTVRAAPDPTSPEALARAAADDAELASLHTLIADITTSSTELQRATAHWLAHHAAHAAGPATSAWVRPALDALDRDQPLPAPFDNRQEALAAVHRDLCTLDGHRDHTSGPDDEALKAPSATVYAVRTALDAAEPDPSRAFITALGSAAGADRRPDRELRAELRAQFLPSAADFLGLTKPDALDLAHRRGWTVRDKTPGGFYTSELRSDRINIVLDERGLVTHATVG